MPSLSEELMLASDAACDLSGMNCTDEDASDADIGHIDIEKSQFHRCSFYGARFHRTCFQNVIFEGCDFSGARFYDCRLKHVEFRSCRLTGAVFSDCILEDDKLPDCQGRYLNLSGNTLKRVSFDHGSFKGAYLARCKCTKVTVSGCDFTGCDFTGTNLDGFDFTTCTIDGSIWSLDKVRHMKVTPEQALDFARLLGLEIIP